MLPYSMLMFITIVDLREKEILNDRFSGRRRREREHVLFDVPEALDFQLSQEELANRESCPALLEFF